MGSPRVTDERSGHRRGRLRSKNGYYDDLEIFPDPFSGGYLMGKFMVLINDFG